MKPSLQQALDEALRPLFGPNLEAYYAELARHDAELRAIPARIEQKYQAQIHAVLNARSGNPCKAGDDVASGLQALQDRIQAETREALLVEHALHRRNADTLKVKADVANGPSTV